MKIFPETIFSKFTDQIPEKGSRKMVRKSGKMLVLIMFETQPAFLLGALNWQYSNVGTQLTPIAEAKRLQTLKYP